MEWRASSGADGAEQGISDGVRLTAGMARDLTRRLRANDAPVIAAIERRHGVPILEDDHVREVRFGSPIPPPLAACDPRGAVIHTGSFTRSLLPALRLGYIVARGPRLARLVTVKRTADRFSSTLSQRAPCRYLEGEAIRRGRAARQPRRPEATWTGVGGGRALMTEPVNALAKGQPMAAT